MSGDSFDVAADERELARLAYSRPVDGVDPAAAQAQLAALAETRRLPPETQWHTPHMPTVATRRGRFFVAAATALALALASAAASTPVSSLAVFDRPQSDAPAWPGGNTRDTEADKIRWLTSDSGWDVFAFITTGGNICVAGFEGRVSAGGACTSEAVFDTVGLRLGMSRTVDDSSEFLSVRWGPAGAVQKSDRPLAEWTR